MSSTAVASGGVPSAEHTAITGVCDVERGWISRSSVALGHGTAMMQYLDGECTRIAAAPLGSIGIGGYASQVFDVHRVATDALMSAVHREIFFHHINSSDLDGYHVATDPEEMFNHCDDPTYDSEDDEEQSTGSGGGDDLTLPSTQKKGGNMNSAAGGSGAGGSGGAAGTSGGSGSDTNSKLRKREEAKKRRVEDEQLLHERKVRDEKGHYMMTVGPFPLPRLTLRGAKAEAQIPSRRTLNQRSVIEQDDEPAASSSDSEPDTPSGTTSTAVVAAAASSSGNDTDTVAHLLSFLNPLTMDTLKKVSESAKVKLKANCTHDEAVHDIVRSAIRLGCEKACVLMDKNKILDKVAQHTQTTRTHILSQLASSIPTFLNSLSEDLLRLLGPTLGIPGDTPKVNDMWERIVAMGLCGVLTNLRPRPLRKIAQELTISIPESASTEKHCEVIVFTAFPKEKQRVKHSRVNRRTPGVSFTVNSARTNTVGDMGVLSFRVNNVSMMRQDTERHYSPEFEFGGSSLRWSLLCMYNKENLALYLCQQGTVHCKFIITVVNHINFDDSVFNEGTQKFSSASAENDWGFNNVIRFDQLLDPKHGFLCTPASEYPDSIVIDVSIVLVEPISHPRALTQPAVAEKTTAATAHQQQHQSQAPAVAKDTAANTGKEGGSGASKSAAKSHGAAAADNERIVQSVAEQLLESERLEATKKKIKAEMAKMQKDEEKIRKESAQKALKQLQQLVEQYGSERTKLVREIAERERKEQQERAREADRARQFAEQANELKRRVAELTEENAELKNRHKNVTTEVKDLKAAVETEMATVKQFDVTLQNSQRKVSEAAEVLAAKQAKIQQLSRRLEEKRAQLQQHHGVQQHHHHMSEDPSEVIRSVQEQFVGDLLGW